MKFAAAVTLYNPNDKNIDNIKKLSSSFEKIYLFDNSDKNPIQGKFESVEHFDVISEGENKGLPYAFNRIIERCAEFDFLCTLDQDSFFDHMEIEIIKSFIENEIDLKQIGAVGPFIDYGNNNKKSDSDFEEKDWVITSGCFWNLNVIRKDALHFDENYFIDRMEVDMCKLLSSKNYKILMCNKSTLRQSLGDLNKGPYGDHSPIRHYYIFRNRFYYNNKWYKGVKKVLFNVLQTLRHILFVVQFESNKLEKIKMLKVAISDYRSGNMGRMER